MCLHHTRFIYIHRKSDSGLLDKRAGSLQDSERRLLNTQLSSHGLNEIAVDKSVAIGYRLVLEHEMYYCSRYTRVKLRNSYTVKYSSSGGSECVYGQIQFFVSVQNHLFAFIQKLTPYTSACKDHFLMAHGALDCVSVSKFVPVNKGDITCVPVTALIRNCVFVNISDRINNFMYVISFPNDILSD